MSLRKQLARLLFSALGIPAEGQLLGFDNAAQLPGWVDPAGGSETLIAPVVTSGSFSKTSDTAYADVTDLAITLPSNGRYWIDVMLPTSANASGGMKVQLSGATLTVLRGYAWASSGVTAGSHITSAVLYAVTTSMSFITARILINVTDVTTPLKLQMAQNNSNAAPSTISSGAVMSAIKVS